MLLLFGKLISFALSFCFGFLTLWIIDVMEWNEERTEEPLLNPPAIPSMIAVTCTNQNTWVQGNDIKLIVRSGMARGV